MELFDLVTSRKSIRHFAERDVEQNKIDRLLQTARLAPSAGNLKSYAAKVVRDAETRLALSHAAQGQPFIAEAPIVLVFLADEKRSADEYGLRGAKLFCVQDATIAAAYAQLAGADQGLASCWVGAFNEDGVAKILGARSRLRPVVVLPIGYASDR